MTMRGSVRVGLVGWLAVAAGSALGQAGSTLPAAQPTTPATMPAVSAQVAVAKPAQEAEKRAKVTWVGGELTIAADNTSLNQILREVSRVTGLKVTGGVADERVYGSYGPGSPGEVLVSLLTGTGSNMLLKENAQSLPVELVLSPRQGGATPPGPASYAGRGDEREDDLPPQRIAPSSRARVDGPQPGRAPEAPATVNPGAGGTGAAAAAAETDAGTPAPAAAATDQQSPNGVKTPQEIYDQLMKLQQQKAASTPHE